MKKVYKAILSLQKKNNVLTYPYIFSHFFVISFELACIIILCDPEEKTHWQDRSSLDLPRRYLNLTSTSASRVSLRKRMTGAKHIQPRMWPRLPMVPTVDLLHFEVTSSLLCLAPHRPLPRQSLSACASFLETLRESAVFP